VIHFNHIDSKAQGICTSVNKRAINRQIYASPAYAVFQLLLMDYKINYTLHQAETQMKPQRKLLVVPPKQKLKEKQLMI
jgi:hypothetical protein